MTVHEMVATLLSNLLVSQNLDTSICYAYDLHNFAERQQINYNFSSEAYDDYQLMVLYFL